MHGDAEASDTTPIAGPGTGTVRSLTSALGAAYRRRGTMKFLFVNSGTFAQADRLASDSN